MDIRNLMKLAPVVLLAACSTAEEELPEQTVQQLMANEVQPTAEIYWDAVSFESELVDGEVVERDLQPETDEDWENVRLAAVKLGEYGELMQTPAYAEGRGDAWLDFSRGLVDVSQLAEQAAVEQDVDKVFEVGGTVYNVCRACHQMYPPSDMPEGVSEEDLRPTEDQSLQEYLDEDGGA